MPLFLVQHGKSRPADIDPEKGLSAEGISEVERIARFARDHGISVSLIKHSGKKRARQTADIMAAELIPINGVQVQEGLEPLADVIPIARNIDSKADIMLVGHLPFMERLTSYLITGSTDRPVIRFQNGGIICLDEDKYTQGWTIRWALLPEIA